MIIPVVLIFVFCAIMSLCDTHQRFVGKIMFVLVYISLVLIATYRPSDMPDYLNYESSFYSNFENRYEPGTNLIINFVRTFSKNAVPFFALMAMLSVSIKLYAIKRFSNFVWLSLTVYLSNIFILHDMIQIREAVASGLLLFALYYCNKQEWIKFAIVTAVAILFHSSAIAFIIIPVLKSKFIKQWVYLWLIPVSYLLAVSGITFGHLISNVPIEAVQKLVRMYELAMAQDIANNINIFNILQILRIVIVYLLLFNYKKIAANSQLFSIWLKTYIYSLVFYVLSSDFPVFAIRIGEMFWIIEILLIPMLVYVFSKQNKVIGRVVTICIAGVMLYVNIIYSEILL